MLMENELQNNYTIHPDGPAIANLTSDIVRVCSAGTAAGTVTGQVFDFGDEEGNNKFSVMVKKDTC